VNEVGFGVLERVPVFARPAYRNSSCLIEDEDALRRGFPSCSKIGVINEAILPTNEDADGLE
jgi:hypothetical protein